MDIEKENYRQTEIGLIPEDWEVVRLGDVVETTLNGDWGNEKSEDNLVECLVIRGTDFSKVEKKDTTNIPTRFLRRKKVDKIKCKPFDILVELSGGSAKQPTGRITIISNEFLSRISIPVCYSNFVKKIFLNEKIIIPKFFYRYWQFLYLNGKTSVYEKRTTGIRNFKIKEFFENEYIFLPPLPEQKAIAEVLDKVRNAIEQTEEVIKATKELKKSLMKHLFTYGAVPVEEIDKVKLKETEIGLIPEHWEIARIKDVFEFTVKPRKLKISENDLLPFIPMDFISEEKKQIKGFMWKKAKEITSGSFVFKNDLIIAKITPSFENGKQAILDTLPTNFGYATTEVYALHPFDENQVINEILYFYLKIPKVRKSLSSKMDGTTGRQRVPKHILENLLIPLPPISEQKQIAEILTKVDKKIEAEENKKQALEKLFKSLLNNLMTGKIRVNRNFLEKFKNDETT